MLTSLRPPACLIHSSLHAYHFQSVTACLSLNAHHDMPITSSLTACQSLHAYHFMPVTACLPYRCIAVANPIWLSWSPPACLFFFCLCVHNFVITACQPQSLLQFSLLVTSACQLQSPLHASPSHLCMPAQTAMHASPSLLCMPAPVSSACQPPSQPQFSSTMPA